MDMEQLYNYLPRELVTFVLVTLFSLLIGLSQRRISLKREGETTLFGTDRTFTFIGILGYLLYILDPTDMRLFMGGGAVLGLLLGLNYYVKQSQFSCFWCYYHYYCVDYLLHGSYRSHSTFLVLRHGDCDGASFDRTETYVYRICSAYEE